MDDGLVIINLFNEISSEEFINNMITVLDFWKVHTNEGENPVDSFIDTYNKRGPSVGINLARRYIDMVYTKIRILHELSKLSDIAVLKIMEPGSISQFLLHVQPLSENKPLPKPDIHKQREFWEKILAYSKSNL
jgi:hypothetical protein